MDVLLHVNVSHDNGPGCSRAVDSNESDSTSAREDGEHQDGQHVDRLSAKYVAHLGHDDNETYH